jgi:signal transduction histidine kinase
MVPVIVGDQHLGYVHINLLLDNIREIQHDNFMNRLLATSLVFILGMVVTIFLARRYTEPINRLAAGVKQVARGDLSVTFSVDRRDETGQLAENFNEMVQKLREREALEKRLFEAEHLSKVGQLASGIAHEIRNPLNYISLAMDHLKTDILASCPDRREELEAVADTIREEVRRANYMVLTFMNYGRPLKLRYAPFAWSELAARALPLVQKMLDEKGIRLENRIPESLPDLTADQEMLRNCLVNLLSNAIQAMPEGGTITLGARFEPETGLFYLSVSDTGVGIPAEDMERVFQPYYTSHEAGIGLGLAITERVIKAHGGTIEVKSSPGTGTTFTFILPQSPPGDSGESATIPAGG